MIKVLHVTRELGSGGIEALLCNLYHNINREKIQFGFAIHWAEEGMHESEVKELGAEVFRFKNLRECRSVNLYKKQWHTFWRENSGIYGIVHIHYMSHAGLIAEVAKQYGIATVVHSHSTDYERWHQYLIEKYITNRNLLTNVDYQLACSKKAGIFFFGKKFAQAGIIIKNAIELGDFEFSPAKRKDLRQKKDLCGKLVIGHVGNYVYHKGQDFMLKIFAEVARRRPDAILVWAGKISSKDFPHVQKIIQNEGIQKRVLLLGRTNNIADWMQAFDVFLFPSLFEGLGMVLIEAQAAGLKCVISNQIPQEAVVTDLVTRCNLEETPTQWAQKILSNCEYVRRSQKKSMITSGYDIHQVAFNMEKFYESIENAN